MKTLKHILSPLIAFATICASSLAMAKEGFFQEPGQGVSEEAWASTVGIYANKTEIDDFHFMGIGTGVILSIEFNSISGKTYLSILTVAHNFFPIENGQMVQRISEKVVQSALVVTDFKSEHLMPERTQFQAIADTIIILKSDIPKDLALIQAEVRTNSATREFSHLTLRKNCDMQAGDTLYAIGHPSTDLRTAKNISIRDSEWTIKRWSQGVLSNSGFAPIGQASSSYDCLAGCSGGPVLDADNKLVGIHQMSTRAEGQPYFGDDKNLGKHSTFASCNSIHNFLEK